MPESKKDGSKIKKLGYIQKHWKGELSLRVSFWVNFCFLSILINYMGNNFHVLLPQNNPLVFSQFKIIWAIFLLLAFYPWQLIGLWRASSRQIQSKKNVSGANAVKGIIGFLIFFILASAIINWNLKEHFKIGFLKSNVAEEIRKNLPKYIVDMYENEFQKDAEEIRKTLPIQIDDITTLTNVESSGLTLTYFSVLDKPIKEIEKETFHKQMTSRLTHNLCITENVLFDFNIGATYIYNYQDKNGLLIDILEININNCIER